MRYRVMKAYFIYCDSMQAEATFDGLNDFNKKYGKLF
jgi:hypothetical protein